MRCCSAVAWPTRCSWRRDIEIGSSLAEPDRVDDARRLIVRAPSEACASLVPTDVVVARSLDSTTASIASVEPYLPTRQSSTSVPKPSPAIASRSPAREPSSGTDPWACSSGGHSRRVPSASRAVWPSQRLHRRRRRRLVGRDRGGRGWRSESTTSRPAAARHWSISRGESCRGSPPSLTHERDGSPRWYDCRAQRNLRIEAVPRTPGARVDPCKPRSTSS